MQLRIGVGIVFLLLLIAGIYFYAFRPVQIENRPLILGHGGSGVRSLHPMNSLESVQAAFTYPIDGIELDVQMTRDGKLVAFHDSLLELCTNCTGNVESIEWENLNECKYSSMLVESGVSSVQEILEICPKDVTISLDLKTVKEKALFVNRLVKLISEYPEHHFLLESNDVETLITVQKASSTVRLFLVSDNVKEGISVASPYGFTGLSIKQENFHDADMEQIRNSNLQVMLWGTGSILDNRKTLLLGPRFIQTDDISSMMRMLP